MQRRRKRLKNRLKELKRKQVLKTATDHYGKITNYNTILSDVDKALGRNKPPSLEYIYVTPYVSASRLSKFLKKYNVYFNPYGHAAIRYTLPTGEDKVMNIVGVPGVSMVNFLNPVDYFFGLPEETGPLGSEQGGVYCRTYISLRIEDLPPEKLIALDEYFKNLHHLNRQSLARFSVITGPLWNLARKLKSYRKVESGNCAYWTAKGLEASGIVNRPTMWPKMLWVKLFLEYGLDDTNNVNIVMYKCVGKNDRIDGGRVAPFHWRKTHFFKDLDFFANVIVDVPHPEKEMVAVVVRPEDKMEEDLKKHFQSTGS